MRNRWHYTGNMARFSFRKVLVTDEWSVSALHRRSCDCMHKDVSSDERCAKAFRETHFWKSLGQPCPNSGLGEIFGTLLFWTFYQIVFCCLMTTFHCVNISSCKFCFFYFYFFILFQKTLSILLAIFFGYSQRYLDMIKQYLAILTFSEKL